MAVTALTLIVSTSLRLWKHRDTGGQPGAIK
jgi:hypothetical protein